jgi:hypothetical protein
MTKNELQNLRVSLLAYYRHIGEEFRQEGIKKIPDVVREKLNYVLNEIDNSIRSSNQFKKVKGR